MWGVAGLDGGALLDGVVLLDGVASPESGAPPVDVSLELDEEVGALGIPAALVIGRTARTGGAALTAGVGGHLFEFFGSGTGCFIAWSSLGPRELQSLERHVSFVYVKTRCPYPSIMRLINSSSSMTLATFTVANGAFLSVASQIGRQSSWLDNTHIFSDDATP